VHVLVGVHDRFLLQLDRLFCVGVPVAERGGQVRRSVWFRPVHGQMGHHRALPRVDEQHERLSAEAFLLVVHIFRLLFVLSRFDQLHDAQVQSTRLVGLLESAENSLARTFRVEYSIARDRA